MQQTTQAQIARYCAYLHEWNAAYEEYAKSVGLSHTALTILSELHAAEHRTQKELAELCFLPKQTVNAVITTFRKKGWVRLEEMPQDRRNKTIAFTPEGKTAADEILSRVRESERKAMEGLTDDQQEALIELTKTYITQCITAMSNA